MKKIIKRKYACGFEIGDVVAHLGRAKEGYDFIGIITSINITDFNDGEIVHVAVPHMYRTNFEPMDVHFGGMWETDSPASVLAKKVKVIGSIKGVLVNIYKKYCWKKIGG